MDILQFVNSKDIRNYLKEINYQFNTLEAAWLIYQSKNHSLNQKIKAWKMLMNEYPDCSVEERPWTKQLDSLFAYLSEYIKLQKELVAEIKKDDGVYTIESIYLDDYFNSVDEILYSSIDAVRAQMEWEYLNDKDIIEFVVKKYSVFDKYNTEPYKPYTMVIKPKKMQIMSVGCGSQNSEKYEMLDDVFNGLWFDFPTPFKNGDIACTVYRPNVPFVLTDVGFDSLDKNIYENLKANGDYTDMSFPVLYCSETDGTLTDFKVYDYMNVEYYTKELKDTERTLVPISKYIKGEIKLQELCEYYHALVMKNIYKNSLPYWLCDE